MMCFYHCMQKKQREIALLFLMLLIMCILTSGSVSNCRAREDAVECISYSLNTRGKNQNQIYDRPLARVSTPKLPLLSSNNATFVARPPDLDCFGEVNVDDAERVLEVISCARESGLLGYNEAVAFDPTCNFYRGQHGREIEYYLDNSILVILWKENIDEYCCTFVEIKVRDAGQFRRIIADDTFESPNQFTATVFAEQSNAVLAMNADYYRFRQVGILVYDHKLCRFNEGTYTGTYKMYNCVDTLFVTDEGDFIFKYQGEENTRDSIQQFVEDNKVSFSLAFGPVLVENGEPLVASWYPLGEIDEGYSRAGIGQIDHLHYLYMSVNYGDLPPEWTVNVFAQHFAEKPVKNAYCLDGGRTAEVVFRGEPYNFIDSNRERETSDILAFVTATGGYKEVNNAELHFEHCFSSWRE